MKHFRSMLSWGGAVLLFLFFSLSLYSITLERDPDSGRYHILAQAVHYIEDIFYDLRLRMHLIEEHEKNPEKLKSREQVLVSIDDESLHKLGRWPWPRSIWATFMGKMKELNPKVVVYDVIFSEEEKVCNGAPPDQLLARGIEEYQKTEGNFTILPYSLVTDPEDGLKTIPETLLLSTLTSAAQQGSKESVNLDVVAQWINATTFPIKTLLDVNPALGFIGATEDQDGVFRNYQVLTKLESQEGDSQKPTVSTYYVPSLALETYHLYTGKNLEYQYTPENGPELVIKDKVSEGTSARPPSKLKLDGLGEIKVRYRLLRHSYPDVSANRIMSANTPEKIAELKKVFVGKIVFVGPTAFGAHDLRHTPIDAKLPGVYTHMSMVDMLLQQHFFQSKERSFVIGILFLSGGVLLLLLGQLLGNALVDIVVLLGVSFAAWYLDKVFYFPKGYEIPLGYCLLGFFSNYSWTTLLNFYFASRDKKQIRGTFSRYVAPSIVNEMLSNPDKLKIGGEKKEITVFFSDVRDFTAISEKLTAQELSTCLNVYMGKMTDIIFEHKGTLDKYIGDAIVAYWGAPLSIENHAYWAVKAATVMMDALPGINAYFKEHNMPQFNCGLGLNTGECSVGNMGSDKIFSYTALGDNMNLGARLEGLTKFYGVKILISEMTLNAIPPELRKEFVTRLMDKVVVKGKTTPVLIYEVLHPTHSLFNDSRAIEKYHKAYELFLNQQFKESLAIQEDLLLQYPEDYPVLRLKKNTEAFILMPPPPDWDGVTHYKEK